MRHVVTSPIALVAASARPSGLHVILLMGAFILAVPITSPFPSSFKNQTAIDPSLEPEASRVPLGAKDRQDIGLSCSSNSPGAVPSGPESLKLQTVTVSDPPVARRVPLLSKVRFAGLPGYPRIIESCPVERRQK